MQDEPGVAREREFFIDNLLVRVHFILVMIWWTGLAPWEFEFSFPGSLASTFLIPNATPGCRTSRAWPCEWVLRLLSPPEASGRLLSTSLSPRGGPVLQSRLATCCPHSQGQGSAVAKSTMSTHMRCPRMRAWPCACGASTPWTTSDRVREDLQCE